MTLVAGDKSFICGCKTNLAFIQQVVKEAYYFMPLWIRWLSRSFRHCWCSEQEWFWSWFRLVVARVTKSQFKTWSSTCAAPFMRKVVLHSELLWALTKVLNLKFNACSLKRDSLTCRTNYASCCLLLHLDGSQIQEVIRFEIGNNCWDYLF